MVTPTQVVEAADDRDDLGDVKPGRPATLKDLVAFWRDRDVLYAKGSKALRPDQIQTIRDFRKKEVFDLPAHERAKAWTIANGWYPPQHGQGTGDDQPEGLRSWL